MNKQTKILLGVGAVIAAYLILKPKKAVAQEPLTEKQKDHVPPQDLQKTELPPAPFVPYIDTAKLIEKLLKNQNCVCAKEPCNCGGSERKVQIDYAPRSNNNLTPW
jgi:hypothetical protein